jgi:hypothetical protein
MRLRIEAIPRLISCIVLAVIAGHAASQSMPKAAAAAESMHTGDAGIHCGRDVGEDHSRVGVTADKVPSNIRSRQGRRIEETTRQYSR